MQQLIYIANIRLPTEKAHGLQIVKTCEALASGRVELELVAPNRVNFFKDDIFTFYNLERNFIIKKLPCIDLLPWPYGKKIFFWLEILTFALAVLFYLRGKSGIYYTRDLLLAMILPYPRFYEIHTLPKMINFVHRWVWRRCQGLVVISEGLKNELINQGIEEKKVLVARDAVDLKIFEDLPDKINCRQKLKLPIDKKIVIYTGHLYAWKGADILAKTAGLLPEEVWVYLVGGTAEDIEAFRKKYNFSNLKIIGWRPPMEIPLWLKAADVLVLPNSAKEKIGAVYTSPLKLFEYMASGVPIVASDLPSFKEILTEIDAIFFEPDNINDLARSINLALQDYKLSGKIALNSYLKGQNYRWSNRAGLIINFLKKSLFSV